MKRVIILIIIVFLIICGGILSFNVYNNNKQKQNQKRYADIKKDINKELKRYIYVIAPKCYPYNGGSLITHRDLVYNGGMDIEKLLDIDKKSYCKVYAKAICVEVGEWDWDIMISCKDYEDEGYVDWAEAFQPKQ